MSTAAVRVAEQTYSLADVCRLLGLPAKRARELMATGEMLGPDVVVPGAGHKAERWTASRVGCIQAKWSVGGSVSR